MAKKKVVNKETGDVELSDNGLTVLRCIQESKKEAEAAKLNRLVLNKQNFDCYLGAQNFAYKQAGQSREFLPKLAVATEQFSAFIKNGLVSFGNWFSVDTPEHSPLNENEVRELLKCFLDNLADGMREYTTFALRASDGVKLSLLEALITFKVHGYRVQEDHYAVERGYKFVDSRPKETTKLKKKELYPWRLAIDIVRAVDYFPDPTTRNLYRIHRVEKDFHDVVDLADQGIYDPEMVQMISDDFDDRLKEWEDQKKRNQQGVSPPSFRKTVAIDEYWGDLIDENGELIERNIVCAMANEKYLIRKPEPNPFWHGESPFVSFPLIRVPDTVWHKALFDHASPLNLALNEILNLIVDGGLASVWGIKQLRMGGLEDPRQVTGGVAQGATLAVKDEFPVGEKVLEQVSTGQVPQDALNTFALVDREFGAASLADDLARGMLPAKEVRATEVVQIQQSRAVTLQGIITDMEYGFTRVLEKAWMTIWQNADIVSAQEIIQAIGPKAALTVARMTKAERFSAFGQGYGIKVHGLSDTMAQVKDFQKIMAAWQMIQGNPVFMESFMRRFSGDPQLDKIFKLLNINPEDLGLKSDEKKDLPNRINRMAALSQVFGVGTPGTMKQGEPGGVQGQIAPEVNQMTNPLSGTTPGM